MFEIKDEMLLSNAGEKFGGLTYPSAFPMLSPVPMFSTSTICPGSLLMRAYGIMFLFTSVSGIPSISTAHTDAVTIRFMAI